MKSLFKAATAYRLVDPDLGLENLHDHPIEELAPGQISRAGWASPNNGEDPWFNFSSFDDQQYTLLCMVTIEKKLKPAAINRELAKRIKAEEKQGRAIGRKQRIEIKEQIVFDHLPTAMPEESRTYAYFDWVNNLMVIDQSSVKKCDTFTSELRKALGSLKVEPLRSANLPDGVMLAWMKDNAQPSHIELCGDALFKNPIELSQTASVKHVEVDGAGVMGLIEDGMVPQELSLSWSLSDTSSINFVVTDSVVLKSIKFSDNLIHTDEEYEDAVQEYAAAMLINCQTITSVINGCFGLFGGISE